MTRFSLEIEGFEKITEKKFPKNFWLSLVGPPGCFKSIICIAEAEELMKNNNVKVIFVTTEAGAEDIITQARTFGFNWRNRVEKGELFIIDTEGTRFSNGSFVPIDGLKERMDGSQMTSNAQGKDLTDLQTLTDAILFIRQRWELSEPSLLIIDSVATLWDDKPAMSRKYFRFIRRRLKVWFNLAIITSQLAVGTNKAFGFGVEHGADGIIRVGKFFENGEMKHWILCDKLRGLQFAKNLFSINVGDTGPQISEKIPMRGRYMTVYDAFSGQGGVIGV